MDKYKIATQKKSFMFSGALNVWFTSLILVKMEVKYTFTICWAVIVVSMFHNFCVHITVFVLEFSVSQKSDSNKQKEKNK